MKKNTYYHILNVSPRASDEDVRRAWRKQALRWHPDRNPCSRAQAKDMFVLVNRAYTVLKTRPQRQAYNRTLLRMSRCTAEGPRNATLRRLFLTVKEVLWPYAADGMHHG
ncbi:MAG: J domain-containing protein [Proteobacteria bacterium]|nr:J domain-containing protein [Pseudomonadota bacterium]